jgi:glycosyltransferase involved in cell wall biosynthesis
MASSLKTTVIIPTFNRVELLGRAVDSLLRQRDVADLDLLVVDDGSTDDTPRWLEHMSRTQPAIRVVRQANCGVAAARNTGLANLLPSTELVTFLDSDDLSPPGRFAADLPRFASDQTLDLTYGKMMLVDRLNDDALAPAAGARSIEIVGIHLSAAILRRRVIDRVGMFDVEFRQAEDTDYLLRVFESGARFAQTETLCLYYRRHADNMTRDTETARRSFAAAVLKSLRRRKANPQLTMNKPRFDVQALSETGFF